MLEGRKVKIIKDGLGDKYYSEFVGKTATITKDINGLLVEVDIPDKKGNESSIWILGEELEVV